MRWELAACLVCAWVLVYFAIWKSIKSSAKVRYITTTLPFLLIIVFLGRSLTLDGADMGLRYFFKPDWELLKQSRPWVNAASQIFNSIGIAFGSMIMFASYNRFDNNFLHDTLAVSLINAVTSLIVGIFTFATIGNIAFEQNTSVKDVIADSKYHFTRYCSFIFNQKVISKFHLIFFMHNSIKIGTMRIGNIIFLGLNNTGRSTYPSSLLIIFF